MISHGLANYTLFVVAAIATAYILLVSQATLVPLMIAFYIWHLINALAGGLSRFSIGRWHPRPGMSFALAVMLVLAVLWLLTELIIDNVTPMAAAAPHIEAQVKKIITQGMAALGFQEPHGLHGVLDSLNLRDFFAALVRAVRNIAGMGVTILLYLAFLFVEQSSFDWKLTVLIGNADREAMLRQTLQRVGDRIRTYVCLKTLTCLLVAGLSALVLLIVGLQYATFWAILIFVLNFIPYLGPAIGIALAALATMVQFQTFGSFLVVVVGLGIVSFIVGSIVEPRLFGKSLNISPLGLLLSLAIWGSLWGVVGMILCIPIMVMILIVLDCFPRTRPLALVMAEKSEGE